MIHSAVFGSIERFMGLLIEHFAGDFPLWIAPEQIRIILITDAQIPAAEALRLRATILVAAATRIVQRLKLTLMKLLLIGLVRLYQILIAPLLRQMNGGHGHCRHDPSCSNYAIEALRVHGAIKGGVLAAWRLLRCHPRGTHGYDPVLPAKVRGREHHDVTPGVKKGA